MSRDSATPSDNALANAGNATPAKTPSAQRATHQVRLDTGSWYISRDCSNGPPAIVRNHPIDSGMAQTSVAGQICRTVLKYRAS
jgi:hypothetical protein